jgi:PPK2 family polyphosphate:nucleotide phosphotransferase
MSKNGDEKKSRRDISGFVDPFVVSEPKRFRIDEWATAAKGGIDKAKGQKILESNRERLSDLQERLYADDHWSVLLIFQGMDASGKDSAVEHVMHGVNPQGCEVTSFKAPSSLELDHDYLWRSTIALPQRGHIGIFNRSYYEELLVVRVHPEILAKQKLPKKLVTRNIWRERFEDVNAFERYMVRNGTLVLKFFMHLSKEEQRTRFLDRLEEPAKRWKFEMGDVKERALWDKYQAAYQDVIRNTSTEHAPWHVVPADHKWFARVVISLTIVKAMEALDLQYPTVSKASLAEYRKIQQALEAEAPAEPVA